MGRKPVAQKLERKPSMGGEKQLKSSSPPFEKAGLQSEKVNMQDLATTESLPKPQTTSAGLSSVSNAMKCVVDDPTRSKRHLTKVTSRDKEIDHEVDEISLSGSEEAKQKSLEEKLNYLVQQFEEQQKTMEALKLKIESNSSQDISCRNLYLDLQKKIETLIDEKHQLALKLEHALGKIEAYENGASVLSKGLDKMKDIMVCTNLSKTTETATKFSSQAAGAEAKTGDKRKRVSVRKCYC